AFENSWPVVAGFHWHGYFEAAVTTRIRPRDIVVGRLLWTGVRLLVILVIFVVMAALLGAIELAPGFGAVGPALLSGLVTGLLVQAVASHLFRSDQLANVFRYGVVPTFLFSGTFFPISQLPTLMQPLAWLTPLWHGVELSRAVALDEPTAAPALVHLGALVAMGALGFVLSARQFDRRLIS
ncbi:MAG: ABC transporter permease, partial [Nitriliruptorales bacterium]|nr:ABC transporter permease [Nitriliruptorales bacterium]